MGWMAAVMTGLLAVLPMTAALAEKYPTRPITIVIGFTPGGSNDVVARIVARQLEAELSQPVVVENRPGASGTLGTNYVAKSRPDGYTLALGSLGPLVISQSTYADIPYDTTRDFEPVNSVALTPEVICVNAELPVRTLGELVALSDTRPVTIATSGTGGLTNLAIDLLRGESGGDFVAVPYKGAGPAISDTVGGHVDAVVMDLPALAPQIDSGKLRAVAVTNRQRSGMYPEVPTSGEQGLGRVQAVNWFGLLAPRGTPPSVVATLDDALHRILSMPSVREQLGQQGLEVFVQESPAAFGLVLRDEVERWKAIARSANIAAK